MDIAGAARSVVRAEGADLLRKSAASPLIPYFFPFRYSRGDSPVFFLKMKLK
jgi:hypothetical protein